jgi:hypothetical protein
MTANVASLHSCSFHAYTSSYTEGGDEKLITIQNSVADCKAPDRQADAVSGLGITCFSMVYPWLERGAFVPSAVSSKCSCPASKKTRPDARYLGSRFGKLFGSSRQDWLANWLDRFADLRDTA